jgi:hypothetical protein
MIIVHVMFLLVSRGHPSIGHLSHGMGSRW